MNASNFIYRNSAYFFVLFFLLALWAFWPGYFGRLQTDLPARIHVHGISMTLWCLLLISQALLIRFRKQQLHKMMGRLSFILVPIILISGFHIGHASIAGLNLSEGDYYSSIALIFNALIVFGLLYGLAIYHRKKPMVHARYMIGTTFPMITPLTDRLIYNNFPFVMGFLPTIEGTPMVWLVGFFIADFALLSLVIWEWRHRKQWNIFLVILVLLLAYHMSVTFFYRFSWWQSVGDWIMGLPLS